jgi:hypothetical protein
MTGARPELEGVIFGIIQRWLDARMAALRVTPGTARFPGLRETARDYGVEDEPHPDLPVSPVLRPADRRKLAGTAFHAARRRTAARDFTAWFVATFGAMLSAQGAPPKALIVALAREPDQVRTLTLLALAADVPGGQP